MSKELISIVSRILKTEVTATDRLRDYPTWSSLNHMLIIMEIEDAFNVDLSDEILHQISLSSISELEALIKE
jgi:acyl carrier protein